MPNAPLAVPPKAAFQMLGVGTTKGYQLMNSGQLDAFKIGRATRITTESVHAFVARSIAEQRAA